MGRMDGPLVRVGGVRATERLSLAADVLMERPRVAGRDALDVITTVGFAHAIVPSVWLGIEAVGSDLEGLWENDEAEGGAAVLLGPTLAVAASGRLRLVVGAVRWCGRPGVRHWWRRPAWRERADTSSRHRSGRGGRRPSA
jgi:hypothetical protein